MNYAAHELLEMSEALRTKSAEIEMHGAFAAQCQDQQLKTILMKHQQMMIQSYQQGVSLLQGKGGHITHQSPNFMQQSPSMGMQQPTMQGQSSGMHQQSMAPQASAQSLSDQTMATLMLNTHKTGSMMGMQWANECMDPQLRMFHVNCANLCQEMAYETWSWMNQKGYYNPQMFSTTQTTQMTTMFQPMNSDTMQMMNQPMNNQNMSRNYQ